LWRDNLVNTDFGELYTYDSLNQLASFQRGELNSTKTGLEGSASRSQGWEMDALGNFTSVTTDETEQDRSANAQNQITSIDGLTTPEYDSDGNMTTDQNGNTLIYDAWNRLVAYMDGETTLQSYQYDGLNRRIEEDPGTATDLFYSSDWQVLEEQQDGVATLQYVWSPVYVDAMVMRDQLYSNGTLQERLYVQQDANWNVTGLASTSGTVVERYVYDPYGAVTVLSASWAAQEGSSYDWFCLFQGGRFDGVVGLYNFRNREYNPVTATWTKIDPLGFGGGQSNLYGFVGDNPVVYVDPQGLLSPQPLGPNDLVLFSANKPTADDASVQAFLNAAKQAKFEVGFYWMSLSPKRARLVREAKSDTDLIKMIKNSVTCHGKPFDRIILLGHAGGEGEGPADVGPSISLPNIRLTANTFSPALAKEISGALTPNGLFIMGGCGYFNTSEQSNTQIDTYKKQWQRNLDKIAALINSYGGVHKVAASPGKANPSNTWGVIARWGYPSANPDTYRMVEYRENGMDWTKGTSDFGYGNAL
jgi:RHS repeat-associated protein